jgi:hypothetical protein
MMILVSMLAKTGFFQYLAIRTAKRSRGNPWRLLVTLGAITALLSMFLPNVTTVVLIAPVSILIAEILGNFAGAISDFRGFAGKHGRRCHSGRRPDQYSYRVCRRFEFQRFPGSPRPDRFGVLGSSHVADALSL